MGILDFFRRNKNNKQQNIQQQQVQYPEMELNYSNGTRADVKFKEVVDFQLENGKNAHLQEVEIIYTDGEKQFERKVFYIDPIPMKDSNGNYVYDSARHFENLKGTNLGLIKAFFKKEDLSNLPSDYIGSLTIHQDGRNPSRSFNQKNGFYADYIEQYKRKEQEKQEQASSQIRKFEEQMKEQINKPHEVHYKDSHAEVLTPQMRDEAFKSWKR